MKHLLIILATAALFTSCGGNTEEATNNSNGVQEQAQQQTQSQEMEVKNAPETPLNPNLMGAEVLAQHDFISAELAEALVAARPILGMAQLDKVLEDNGLDATMRKALYPHLFVPINLNTATEAEIFMVPGVGKKMAHEFEEYRPYKNPEQFRREIGKYVDEEEVARFEKFVFVPVPLNSASDDHILSIPGVGGRMLHEFKEYRPYNNMEQFKREIGKYVDDKELERLTRYVVLDA